MTLTIKKKLILGFTATALLVGVVGFFGLTASKQIANFIEEEEEHFKTILTATTELTSYIKRAEGHLMLYLALHKEIDKSKFFKRFASMQEQIFILHDTIKNREAGLILDKIKSLESDTLRLGQSLIQAHDEDMAKTGKFQSEQYEELINKFHYSTSTIREKGVDLTKLKLDLENKAKKAAIRKAALIRRKTFLLMLFVIIVALGLGYFISRSITVPISKLKNATVEIAKGRLDTKIENPSGDEVGDLADSFIKMTESLQKSRWVEEEKKRLEASLLQARKLEAIGTLAGGIAHSFNNLLMAIQGNASLMLIDIDSTHPHYEFLTNIKNQVKSGAQLAAQLLGYARKGKYFPLPVNLNLLVRNASSTIGTTKKELTIHLELEDELFSIEADQSQIDQVLLNLLVNAADAMHGGGDLTLKTTNVTEKDIKGKPYVPKPGNYVQLTVTDTGTGMDKETVERIFDPFFTTKDMGQGTGLGLASTYGIIKGHGGYIDVESELGRGTTFTIYFPSTEKKIEKPLEPSEQIVKGSGTILLVEDEEMVIDVANKVLKNLGYMVLEARGGREAVETYKQHQDEIDLVLLDMVMPDMGGGEAYDMMKEINPKVKVLLSSGYSINSEAKEILARGCDAFIQKPFDMQGLSKQIREILDKKK